MKRQRLASTLATAAALTSVVAIERLVFGSPHYRGPVSDHFDGERFHNLDPGWQSGGSFLKWQASRQQRSWPAWIEAPYGPPPPARVDDGRLRLTFVNHATMLLQFDGLNILTDPVWSDRVSPVTFAGPRRHRAPGIRFQDLPPIHAVLVSHNHYDHLDVATLRVLHTRHDPHVFTPLGCGLLMAKHGLAGAVELDWWQQAKLSDRVTVTLVPAQHFCARAVSDRNRNLWGGFVLSGPSGNIYFAGDTGWGRHFAQIAERFHPIRMAMLPIGAYLPRWFMKPAHIDPVEAVEAAKLLRAQTNVPMHYGTFRLSDEGEEEPVADLRRAIAERGNPPFVILDQGEGREVP